MKLRTNWSEAIAIVENTTPLGCWLKCDLRLVSKNFVQHWRISQSRVHCTATHCICVSPDLRDTVQGTFAPWHLVKVTLSLQLPPPIRQRFRLVGLLFFAFYNCINFHCSLVHRIVLDDFPILHLAFTHQNEFIRLLISHLPLRSAFLSTPPQHSLPSFVVVLVVAFYYSQLLNSGAKFPSVCQCSQRLCFWWIIFFC